VDTGYILLYCVLFPSDHFVYLGKNSIDGCCVHGLLRIKIEIMRER
jgi:hypothetical protein